MREDSRVLPHLASHPTSRPVPPPSPPFPLQSLVTACPGAAGGPARSAARPPDEDGRSPQEVTPSKNRQDPCALPGAAPQRHCAPCFLPYRPLLCVFVLTHKGDVVRKVPEATGTLPHGPSSLCTSCYTWAAPARWDPAYPWAPLPLPSPGEQRGNSPGSTRGRRPETLEEKLLQSFPRALSSTGQRALHVATA